MGAFAAVAVLASPIAATGSQGYADARNRDPSGECRLSFLEDMGGGKTMTMRHIIRTAAIATAVCLASACDKSTSTSAAGPGAVYEAVSLAGSPSAPGGIIRINVSTGQTVLAGDSRTVLVPFLEATPPPPGQYHVYAWTTVVQASGRAVWNAERMDALSGRVWRLAGDGDGVPFSWSEYVPPPKA